MAAALAPTDAALGLPVVMNPAVPLRVRRLITVESGLNDGIVTPVVLFALAAAVSVEELESAPGLPEALAELGIGVAVGVGVGLAGGFALRWSRRRGWAADEFVGIAVLALALVTYTASLAVHGNGFVAAFCGGLAFGAAAGRRAPAELVFLEQAGSLVSMLVWFAFGALAIPIVLVRADLVVVAYAILSLTLVRMVPVALACWGAGLDRKTNICFFSIMPRVIFTSAKSGFHLDRLLEAVRYVAAQLQQKIPTAILNRTLQDAIERRQPVSDAGHRLKFFYATQLKQAPPMFLLFVNRDELFSDQYSKYLARELRRAFGYEGCPIILIARPRARTIEPKRKFKNGRGAPQGIFAGQRKPKAQRS